MTNIADAEMRYYIVTSMVYESGLAKSRKDNVFINPAVDVNAQTTNL